VRWLGLLLLLSAQPATAAVNLKTMNGVWEGTIGTLTVRACYDAGTYRNEGKYYYVRRLATIPLIVDEQRPGDLTEGWADTKDAARWTVTTIAPDRLEGLWTGGDKTLPIRLTRVAFAKDKEFETACASLAFFRPIFDAARLVKTPARVLGVPVERWRLATADKESVSIESVQFLSRDAASAAINRRLRAPFEDSDVDWRWCLRNSGAFGGSYHETIEPTLATNRWLAITEHNESYCGGAHPSNSNVPTLFDRRTGAVVNLMDWMQPTMVHRKKVEGFEETLDSLTGALSEFVVAKHPRNTPDDPECAEVIQTADTWKLKLRRDGIAFTPDLPRVVMACGDELVVSFRDLQPFLNATGKREVAALQAELAKR
jgi:hypothetical protein